MEIIFINSKSLSYKGIVKQLAVGLGIILLVLIISFLRFPGTDHTVFAIFLIIIFLIWTYKSFTEMTLKKVLANENLEDFTFIMEKHFSREEVYSFNKNDVELKHYIRPDRSLPKNEILLIKNQSIKIEISVRQKGIESETIKLIREHLK